MNLLPGLILGLACAMLSCTAHAAWHNLAQPGLSIQTLADEPQALALAPRARVVAVALKDLKGLVWLHADTGAELGRVALGSMPVAIALNAEGDTAYLLLQDSPDVHVFSLTSKTMLHTWPVGGDPVALSLAPDGQALVVADTTSQRLIAFQVASGQLLRSAHLDKAPLQLAHTPDVAGAGRLLVAASGGVLLTLDAATWRETARVSIGDDIRALGVWDGGGMALVVGKQQDALNLINPATGAIARRIPLDGDPEHLSIDDSGHHAYVTTQDDLAVNRIDLHSGALKGRYAIPDRAAGIVFDPVAQALLLSQPRSERLLRLDPAQATLVRALSLKRRPKDLAVNNTTHDLVAIAEQANELTRLNLVTRQGESITLPGTPAQLGLDAGLNRAVITLTQQRPTVVFVDLAPAKPVLYPERLTLQTPATALAVDSLRGRSIVAHQGQRISVINNQTRSLVATIKGDGNILDLAIHSGTGHAYLLSHKGALQQFDPLSRKVVRSWPLTISAQHIAVDATRNLVILSSTRGGKVHLFDLSSGTFKRAFDFSPQPGQIALQPDIALAVILSKESSAVGTLDVQTSLANPAFAAIDKPLRVAVSTRFNQALVLSAEGDDIAIVPLRNPPPVLSSVSPAQTPAGGPALTLTVNGQAFIDGSEVMASGTALVTSWISPNQLQATVPAALIREAQLLNISVRTPGPGGGSSYTVNVNVTGSNPTLASATPASLLASAQPQRLLLAGQAFRAGAIVHIGTQTLVPASVTPTQLTVSVPGMLLAQPGTLSLTVRNPDGTTTAALTLPVLAVPPPVPGPAISSLTPVQGPAGTTVTLTGERFAASAADNQVSFASDATDPARRVTATIVSASATRLVVIVPPTAVTGSVALATPQGTVTGPVFTVGQAVVDVAFIASPVNTTVYQGASTTISLQLANAGAKDYTGLMQLAVTDVPAGVNATFTSPFLSNGQHAALILSASPTAAVTSKAATLTVTATDTAGLDITRSATFRINVAAASGVSAVAGRFVTPSGAGIGGVRVAYQDPSGKLVSQVQSDAAGAFVLTDLPAGSVTLRMDATPAHPLYPIWPYSLTNPGNGVVSMPDWVINPPPADDKFTAIANSSTDQRIHDERYPGLAITLPAGVSITGWDGVKKTRLAVERLTPDKLPVTTPPFPMKEAYQLYFGTPMGGIPSAPIPITLPNVAEAEPGETLDIWFFDGSPMGGTGEWKVAGQGIVSADGQTVTTLPGQGITRFCGVCGLFALSCPPPPNPPPCNTCDNVGGPPPPKGGNPVDLLTGQQAPKNIGLALAGIHNVAVNLSYNPVDAFNGRAGTFASFGLGWTVNYDIVLIVNATQARLFMPGGMLVDFTNAGSNLYTATNNPRFGGARISAIDAAANQWQLTHRDGRVWKFAAFPGITGIIRGGPPLFVTDMIDAQGNATAITRQPNGRINAVGSPGRNIQFSYGSNGFVSGLADSAGRRMQFTYNARDRIDSVTDADNNVTRTTYVDDNEIAADPVCGTQATLGERIKTITYPGLPTPTENFYGVGKRVLRQTAADGRETRFSYHLTGACVTHISQPGTRCSGASCPSQDNWANHQAGWRVHGGQVFATTVTHADQTTETWRFAANRTPTAHVDAQGQTTHYQYDAQKRLIAQTDPLGRVTRTQYDANSKPTLIVDPLHRLTRLDYDDKWGGVTSTTRYNDPTPLGQANPQVRQQHYDPATGVLTAVTSPLQHVTRLAYTAQGLLQSLTPPGGAASQLRYTDNGDLQQIIDPLGHATAFAYDAAGRPVSRTDARGYTSQTTYNGVDQPTTVIDALQGQTRLAYNAQGQLASVTNPLQHPIERNTYDDSGRLISQTNAINHSRTFAYDSAGRLHELTDANGQRSRLDYDPAGRLVTVTRADSVQRFSYDAVGRLTRLTEGSDSLGYVYDAADRLVQHTQQTGTRTTTVDYQYDPLDRVIRRVIHSTDTSGATLAPDTTTYAYDNDDRLTEITYLGDGSRTERTQYRWDSDSRLTHKVLPNGITVAYDYDAAGQLTRSTTTNSANVILERLDYAYNATGQIIRRDSLHPVSQPDTPYTAVYDAANRLTELTLYPGQDKQARYSLRYDANGSLLEKRNTAEPTEVTHYQWDSRHRLVALTAPGLVASFTYDAIGRRTSKTVNGQITTYLYDGQQAVGEIRPSVMGEAGYDNITLNLTGLQLDEAIARYTYTQGSTNGSGTSVRATTLLTDLLGSVIAQTDAAQRVQTRHRYSPYGEVTTEGDEDDNPVQYTGRENDGTGLYFYRARYYDAVAKRFISSDPIGLEGGINTYSYALSNPIRYTDPTGLDVFLCSQPAFGISSNPIDHQWIRTDSTEAGMGGTRGNVPGNDSGDLPGDRVQVTNHSGRSKEAGASCQKVDNVDENKVNEQLKLGRALGRWGPTNQCQSFARGVLDNARTTPPNLAPFDNPALWGF